MKLVGKFCEEGNPVSVVAHWSELTCRGTITVSVEAPALRNGNVPPIHAQYWRGVVNALVARCFDQGKYLADIGAWSAPASPDGCWSFTISGKFSAKPTDEAMAV